LGKRDNRIADALARDLFESLYEPIGVFAVEEFETRADVP
jgi:hypothetical protein